MEYQVLCFGVALKFPKEKERLYVVRADTKEVLATVNGDNNSVGMFFPKEIEEMAEGKEVWVIHNHPDNSLKCSEFDLAVAFKHKQQYPRDKCRFFVTTENGWLEFDGNGDKHEPKDSQVEGA